MVKESKRRSILKAVSWRVTGTIDTFVISYLITGTIKMAASISLVEIATKMTLYFFHERLWNKIHYGRITEKPADYVI